MRGLQIRIELVQAVAKPVVVEREGLLEIARHQPSRAGLFHVVFVDVVAVVVHEIEPLLGDMTVGGKKSRLVQLAADDAEASLPDRCTNGRQRARATDWAALSADRELVEIIARRFEPVDLDMHRMAKFGMRDRGAVADHLPHGLIRRHRPFDLDRTPRHAAAVLERLGRDLGPQHEAVRRRLAAGNAERKRVGGECRRGPKRVREKASRGGEQRRGRKPAQQVAAVDGREFVDIDTCGCIASQ
jgi:hypothetical protein